MLQNQLLQVRLVEGHAVRATGPVRNLPADEDLC